MANFDQVVNEISGKGRYQIGITVLVMYIGIPAAFMNTGAVYLAAIPPHRCKVNALDAGPLVFNESAKQKLFIPWDEKSQRYDQCHLYKYNCPSVNFSSCLSNFTTLSVEDRFAADCNHGYVFDTSVFQSTVVTEWDLVCDRLTLRSFSTSLYYVGMLLGSAFGGILSDRYGRRLIFRVGTCFAALFGVATAFAPNVYVFALFRLLISTFSVAAVTAIVVYVVEISTKYGRNFAGIAYSLAFGVGCLLLGAYAFLLRNWRHLQIALSVNYAVCFVCSLFIDKSPRWAYVHGRKGESLEICRKIARRNGSSLVDDVWEEFVTNCEEKGNDKAEVEGGNTIKEMLKRPFCRYILISNMLLWMIMSLVYYGLTLNIGRLAGDIYVNNMCGGLVEVLGTVLCLPAIAKFGCRNCIVATLLLASLACFGSIVTGQLAPTVPAFGTIGVVLAVIGRFGLSAGWGIMFLHTTEMFPTKGRSSALGAASLAARIGSIATPFTLQLQYSVPWLTQTVFGVSMFLIALVVTSFPETSKRKLTTSFDEAELQLRRHVTKTWLCRMFFGNRLRCSIDDDKQIMDNTV